MKKLSKKFNILFISSWYPNRLEPTNGNFVQRHAEAVALLHNVEVLHVIGDDAIKSYEFNQQQVNGIRTLIIYYKKSFFSGVNFFRKMLAYRKGFKRMTKPDLVHGNILYNNMLFALFVKIRHNIPYVISEHWSIWQKINHRKISFSVKWIAKIIANNTKKLLPVTSAIIEGLKELSINPPTEIIGNVVNTDQFLIQSQKNSKFTFLHISCLLPLKNADKIIMAAIRLRRDFEDFELHIGGDGDEQILSNLIMKNQAEEYIKTFGILTSQEVSRKMQKADCFVLFSDYENQPCVILESLACGLPVIATNVGGIPKMLAAQRGVLIEAGDEEALYEAMKKMYQQEDHASLKEERRAYVLSNFSQPIIAKKLSEIYNKVLNV